MQLLIVQENFIRVGNVFSFSDNVTTQLMCGIKFFVLDFMAKYEETSTTALSDNPDVAVPLLTINR